MHHKRLEMHSITLEYPQNRSESPKIYLFRTKIARICQKNPRLKRLTQRFFLGLNLKKFRFGNLEGKILGLEI